MKVSLVTASYNAASTIGDTLRSIAAQDWPDIEHIVIDGASRDDTANVVTRFQRPGGVFVSERDNGIYDAMNKGIARATGDIVGLLNADDFYPDAGVVRRVVEAFQTHTVDAVLGDVGFVRADSIDKTFRRYDSGRFSAERIGWGWMPAHPAMFLTRDAYHRVGEYRTDYKIAADFEYVARAFGKHRLSFIHLPEILVRMRTGGTSSGLRASLTVSREALRACRDNDISSNALMIGSRYPLKLLEYLGARRAN